MEIADPVRRTLEIEDPSNLYVVHPIANRLTPLFARLGIRPNAVSIAGMAFGVLAGVAYHRCEHAGMAVLGFALMIGWHVMDGVDGQLARLTRSQSEYGKVLDGICDYVTFGAVYIGLALTLSREHGAWVWALVAASGACHAVQSAVYEVQRQDYNFWGRGQASAEFRQAGAAPRDRAAASFGRRIANGLHQAYLGLQHVAIGANADARRRLSTILTPRHERSAPVRELYREVFAPALRRWSVMSANYRTLAIFLFALLGRPLDYFYMEIFGLSAVLVVLVCWQRTRYTRFFKALDGEGQA